MKEVINYILDLGPAVFLPLIMIIVGLIVRMKFSTAFSSALTLGVAFLGMSVVIDFMFDAIGPASEAFVNNTGLQLNILDLGWPPNAAIAWAWPYAFFMFPIQIVINLLMLGFNKTNCLNLDLWNVWNKIFTAVIVSGITNSLAMGFIVASIEVVLELKNADLTQKQIQRMTGIPGIALPHSMALTAVVLAPINRLLDFIPGLKNVEIDAESLKEKLGIFGENHVMGFIIGIFIALFAKYDLKSTLTLAVQAATALTLFPMVATLFMKALAPISDAAGEFMKKRFPGKEIYIGLDWPFLAGQPEVWVTCILLVPVILLMAVILPGNGVLPFGGILNICFAATALIVCNKNLVRMLILGVIATPLYLYVGTAFAPHITNLARQVGTIDIPANQMITWNGMEAPEFRYVFSRAANIINGDYFGLVLLAGYIALYIWYFKHMKAREAEAAKDLGLS
ncbi:MAG: PTS galactitol transporter subunit IIC [Tissierellia bacterium]|nr:PTS galactitol transporter subunit IIC [Tissierellia bacterium]